MALEEQFRKQIEFIRNSCALYDAGSRNEAIRIAMSLRVLFHDTRRGKSLLTQMGATGFSILSTVPEISIGTVFSFGMGVVKLSNTGEVSVEPAMPPPGPLRFLRRYFWWEQVICVQQATRKPPTQLKITRKDVVLGAADKDGGAHVDSGFKPEYKALAEGIWQRRAVIAGVETRTRLGDTQLPFLRQMGYEILNSPELLALGDPLPVASISP